MNSPTECGVADLFRAFLRGIFHTGQVARDFISPSLSPFLLNPPALAQYLSPLNDLSSDTCHARFVGHGKTKGGKEGKRERKWLRLPLGAPAYRSMLLPSPRVQRQKITATYGNLFYRSKTLPRPDYFTTATQSPEWFGRVIIRWFRVRGRA